MSHAIHRYAKANKKYTKDYNKRKQSSYLMYWDAKMLWAMSQELPVDHFEWEESPSKYDEKLVKDYNDNGDTGYTFEVDVEYPKGLHKKHNDLPFLPERMNFKKCQKLVCNLYNKEKYVVYIRTFKQSLNHELILEKIHRIIKFNQKARLKPYIDMNTKFKIEVKNDLNKDFFKERQCRTLESIEILDL